MEVIRLSARMPAMEPCAATIGFFDGVHRGHRYLLQQVNEAAAAAGLRSLAVTFEQHPRAVLRSDYVPQLLSTPAERLLLLGETGLNAVCLLPFRRAIAVLSARDFMADVLRRRLNVVRLVIGYDNRFGRDRAEGFDDYVRYGVELGIDVVRALPLSLPGGDISSSTVRRHLAAGAVETVREYLGRYYRVSGTVTEGRHEGRRIGFPTANIAPQSVATMLPGDGVYATTTGVDGETQQLPSVTNIGTRPTYGGDGRTIETHIIGYDGSLYGSDVTLTFLRRLRSERRFDSPEALAAQLACDRDAALSLWKEAANGA